MAKDLELKVQGDSKSATAALAAAAHEMDRAAREADKMGRAFDAAKRDAEQLDRELLKNAAAVKLLAKEYANADGDIRGSIKARLDAERSAGNELRRVRQDLLGSSEKDAKHAEAAFAAATKGFERVAKDAAADSASVFANGFSDGLSNLAKDPKIVAIGVGIGALLAIPIGAAIGGATLAAAGAAGAGLAGLAAAKADKSGQVAAAGQGLLGDLKGQFLAGGTDAIGPLLAGIKQLRDATKDIHLDQIIRDSAKYIEPLAAGAARMATYLSQGVDDLVRSAGPEIKVLSDELPAIGHAIKEAFDSIAGGSEGGARALQDTLRAVESFIITTGRLIGFLENAYHAVRLLGDGFEELQKKALDLDPALIGVLGPSMLLLGVFDTGQEKAQQYAHALGTAGDATDEFGNAVEQGIGSVGDFRNALTDAAATVDTKWAGAIDAVVGRMLDLDNASLKWDETLTKLSASVDKNGATLNAHTKEGEKNRKVLLDGVEANLRLFDAEVASGKSAEEAGKEFQAHNDQLRAAAIAAGLNADAVDGMIKKYGKVPPEIQTQIEMHGLQEALNNLDETLRLINHLPPRKNVDIDVNVHGNLFAAASAIGKVLGSTYVSSGIGVKKKALGGPVRAGQPYIVGDGGRPELFVPAVNGTILPRVPDAVSRWGGTGMGGQAITVTLSLAGSDTAMGTALHKLVRDGVAQLVAVDSSNNRLPVKVA